MDGSISHWPEKILAECIGEEPPPCQAACPLDIRVREKIRFMQEGKMAEALAVVLERCPFPGILGRICAHPCESACTRRALDQPIAIAGLKRYLADLDPQAPLRVSPGPERPQRVAVVGGGPAGIMAAYELRRLGYPVTLFEAEPFLGGALRLYIPPFRLPREVLDRELGVVEKLGAKIKLRTRLGRDVQLEELRREFAAVFLAVGCHKSLLLEAAGETLSQVWYGLDFLRAFNSGTPTAVGPRVVVIGGGDTAVDAARTALRLGAREVHLLYWRSLDLMPALKSHTSVAQREGVHFHGLTQPVRFLGEGRVQGLLARKTTLGKADASGRPAPVPVPGSEFTLAADTAIIAVGQTADFRFFGPGLGFDTSSKARLDADPISLATRIPAVFAGGDLVTGPRTAVAAFAAGRRAALAIHAYLQQETLPDDLPPLEGRSTNLVVETSGVTPAPRAAMDHLALEVCLGQRDAEVELGFSDPAAKCEADRCLACTCSQCVNFSLPLPSQELHLLAALRPAVSLHGKRNGPPAGGARRDGPHYPLLLPLLRPVPGRVPQGLARRPGLPGVPGASGRPRPGAPALPSRHPELCEVGRLPHLHPEPRPATPRRGLFPAAPSPHSPHLTP